MNYYGFKFTENTNGYYFYFISNFYNDELAQESIEHYIANVPTEMNKYLETVNFDDVKVERVLSSAIDIINNHFPHDDKNMLVSDSYKALIPPPKAKREPKKKAEPKEPKEKKPAKPRGKKSAPQKVIISTENTTVNMDQ